MGTYGIDLGTTYSCIAKLDQNGNPEVIQNFQDGSYTLASAVFFEDSGNTLYGESAKEYMETEPEKLVQFVKREIGKKDGKLYRINGMEYSPIDISALILKKLKQMAEEQGETVENVIITCPAYFGFEEREATRQAGELAGLNVMNLINEPTAAAISYCYREFQDNQMVVVYDLGGGTFDVTVLSMGIEKDENGNEKRVMKEVSVAGDDRLGGKDWDDVLFQMMLERYCEELGMDIDELDVDSRQNVRAKVETVKKALSAKPSTNQKIKSDDGPVTIFITREEFEEATSHLVARTMALFEKAIAGAGDVKIDKVLLVGGSTHMPMIKEAVSNRFPGLVQVEDPDRAVAKGAAIYAENVVDYLEEFGEADREAGSNCSDDVSGEVETKKESKMQGVGLVVETQAPRSFGPGVFINERYMVDNLVKKGEKLPATSSRTYGTMYDNQRRIKVAVFESMTMEDRVIPCQNEDGEPQETNPEYQMKYLGELILDLPENTPKNAPIMVTFVVDVSGIDVTAVNTQTNESNSVHIQFENSMTQEQMEESKKKLDRLTMND